MKVVSFFTLFLFSILCDAKTTVIFYGDSENPPYSYLHQTELKGTYVDIINSVSKSLKDYQIVIKPVPWVRGLKMLENGDAFALFPPYYKKERTYMAYSTPLLKEDINLYCNKNQKIPNNPKFPDDFKDFRIGVNAGFLLTDSFNEARKNKIIKVEESINNDSNILKLISGRIDCYAAQSLSIKFTLNKLKIEKLIPVNYSMHLTLNIGLENGYIGYSIPGKKKFPFSDDFITQFNQAFFELEKSGELKRILSNYN